MVRARKKDCSYPLLNPQINPQSRHSVKTRICCATLANASRCFPSTAHRRGTQPSGYFLFQDNGTSYPCVRIWLIKSLSHRLKPGIASLSVITGSKTRMSRNQTKNAAIQNSVLFRFELVSKGGDGNGLGGSFLSTSKSCDEIEGMVGNGFRLSFGGTRGPLLRLGCVEDGLDLRVMLMADFGG